MERKGQITHRVFTQTYRGLDLAFLEAPRVFGAYFPEEPEVLDALKTERKYKEERDDRLFPWRT